MRARERLYFLPSSDLIQYIIKYSSNLHSSIHALLLGQLMECVTEGRRHKLLASLGLVWRSRLGAAHPDPTLKVPVMA